MTEERMVRLEAELERMERRVRFAWATTITAFVASLAVGLVLPGQARQQPPSIAASLSARLRKVERKLSGLEKRLAAETKAREEALATEATARETEDEELAEAITSGDAALRSDLVQQIAAETQARVDADAGVLMEAKAYVNSQPAARITANQIAALSFFSVKDAAGLPSTDGKEVYLTGANLHIVNGLEWTTGIPGLTDPAQLQVNGLGNLIVGYNERRSNTTPNERIGSHNVVIGAEHNYTGVGGLVAGRHNQIGRYASVISGNNNHADDHSAVSGGTQNIARHGSHVGGGSDNYAWGLLASIQGGRGNRAEGRWTSILGGGNKTLPEGVDLNHYP